MVMVLLEDPLENPLDQTVNRPSMQASMIECIFGRVEAGDGAPPRNCSNWSARSWRSAVQMAFTPDRSSGPELAWFVSRAPSRTKSRWDIAIGAATPDGLGSGRSSPTRRAIRQRERLGHQVTPPTAPEAA